MFIQGLGTNNVIDFDKLKQRPFYRVSYIILASIRFHTLQNVGEGQVSKSV